MPRIVFKAKPQRVMTMEDTLHYEFVKVPAVTRSHCDMPAFRSSRRFGDYANSDFFPSMIKRALMAMGIGPTIKLDDVPAGVSIDTDGFLAIVTIEIPEE